MCNVRHAVTNVKTKGEKRRKGKEKQREREREKPIEEYSDYEKKTKNSRQLITKKEIWKHTCICLRFWHIKGNQRTQSDKIHLYTRFARHGESMVTMNRYAAIDSFIYMLTRLCD